MIDYPALAAVAGMMYLLYYGLVDFFMVRTKVDVPVTRERMTP